MNARLKALFTEEVTKQCVLLVLNDQKIKHFVILFPTEDALFYDRISN